MSTYYYFYLGYRTLDNKVHLLGPCDKFGKFHPMLERSRSFIGNVPYNFYHIDESEMDDEVKIKFGYESYNKTISYNISYLPTNELPSTDFIKSGYFNVDEVLKNLNESEKYFEEYYNFNEYSLKLQSAVISNDTEEINRLKKFIFYSYPDYSSDEYVYFLLNQYISFYGPFNEYTIKDILKDEYKNFKESIIIMEVC